MRGVGPRQERAQEGVEGGGKEENDHDSLEEHWSLYLWLAIFL